jgi:type VI secretion system protein ImpA
MANNAGQHTPTDTQPRRDARAVEYSSLEPVDRPDALRRLAGVAEFFRRTEPHSPVSYLVQRAILWGEMPLESWLQDVINNEDVLGRVRETLGLKQVKPE